MRKHIFTLVLCALAVFALGSCNKVHEKDRAGDGLHSVTFRARLGSDTRTGLSLKFVPDWRETDLDNVRIFKIGGDQIFEGQNVEMFLNEGEYEYAYFTADFVKGVSQGNASNSGSGNTTVFFGSVVAQVTDGKYIVPSVQYPGEETLIDPDADFLVGSSTQPFFFKQNNDPIDLTFIRPVAVSRLSILQLGGSVVKSVTVTSADKLTGSAGIDSIDFSERTVSFDPVSGSEVLTLSYGEGAPIPAEGIFNAYFISLTGAKKILEIVVETDAGTYTKNLGQEGKTLTFKTPDFKSIAVNMSGEGFSLVLKPQEISFVKDDEPITSDSFDLYSTDGYVSPILTGVAEGATVTYDSSNPGVATVSKAGVVIPVGVGETIITASASKTETHEEGHAEFFLTVTDSSPVPQTLSFNPASLSVYVDQEVTPPTLSGAVTTVTYSSSKTAVAEVDTNTGALTIKTAGTTTITATAAAGTVDGVNYAEGTASYQLTITKKTQTIAFTGTDAVYDLAISGWRSEGENPPSLDFSAAETAISYSSSNTAVAEVNSATGAITIPLTARAGDTATITATAVETDEYEAATATYKISIVDSTPEAQTLTFNPASLTGQVGATVTPPTLSGAHTTVTYTSSNAAVAEVDPNTGALTLKAEGSTTITATAAAEMVNGVNYAEGEGSYILTVTAAD